MIIPKDRLSHEICPVKQLLPYSHWLLTSGSQSHLNPFESTHLECAAL